MNKVNSLNLNGAVVYYESGYRQRWLDVIGPSVAKFAPGVGIPVDDTTGDPTGFIMTVTEAGAGGDSMCVNSETAGEQLLFTTDNAEYDGINLQVRGEAFKLTADKPLYMGAQAKASNATELDLLIGLCEKKTDLLKTAAAHGIAAAGVEGVFFFKVDGGTTLVAKVYKDGAEQSTLNVGTLGTDFHFYELFWDGATVWFFLDGVQIHSYAIAANLPDGDLTPSINVRAGNAAVRTLNVKNWRAFQIF